MCGLEIVLEGSTIVSIRGDALDPFSKGHICPKATALEDIYNDPNRLKFPVRRTSSGWERIGWDEAFDEVVSKLRAVQEKYGKNSVGVYQGNPSVHNSGTVLTAGGFFKALGSSSKFSATSADQLPHHFAAWQMLGHPLLIPIPDIDRTDFMLILGANPLVSNGSLMTAAGVKGRLEGIKKRGGKVVLVDPRRTETAGVADQHHFIRPGTDVFLLLAMLEVIFAENLVKLGRLAEFTDGLEVLREAVREFSPEKVSDRTGLDADTIRGLARAFAGAPSAVAYGRIGLSTQAFGGSSQWLVSALNIVTGNFDRAGGAMLTTPAIDLARAKTQENIFNRSQSRVRGLPEFDGEYPVAAMAEEMLTPGEGQIKAFITNSGNPVLSTPNGSRLEGALENLDFYVAIDIYINETTRHADIILPPATGLETDHYDLIFHHLAVRNHAKYSQATLPKTEGAKYDWEIFEELRNRLTLEPGGTLKAPRNPADKLELGLKTGTYKLSLEELKANPHGLDLGALEPRLPERLLTPNKRLLLAPELLLADLSRAKTELEKPQSEFVLIGRRELRSNNSWMHNSERLVRGKNRCTLMIHPQDATRKGISDGSSVRVHSRVGSIELPAEITDAIMPGVLSIPHGYGHAREGVLLEVANQNAGVSINDLTDELELDDLTGNAAFCGVSVSIQAAKTVN
jgi:anaerobic selenocysteine-containing dehydrogenase